MAIRKRKCEKCELEVDIKSEREHPKWWVRTGHSKYARQYDRGGIAWWCPPCYHEKEKYTPQFKIIEAPVIMAPVTPQPDLAFKLSNALLNQGLIIDNISAGDLETAIDGMLKLECGGGHDAQENYQH